MGYRKGEGMHQVDWLCAATPSHGLDAVFIFWIVGRMPSTFSRKKVGSTMALEDRVSIPRSCKVSALGRY